MVVLEKKRNISICTLICSFALPSVWAGSKLAWSSGTKTTFNAKDVCNTKRNKTFLFVCTVDVCRTQYGRNWWRSHRNVADENIFFNLFNYGVAVSGNMASTFRSLVKDEGEDIGKAAVVAWSKYYYEIYPFWGGGASEEKYRSQNFWCSEWGLNVNCYSFLPTLVALSIKKEYCQLSVYKVVQIWPGLLFVCKQAALRSSCATLREWSHNLHPSSCSG